MFDDIVQAFLEEEQQIPFCGFHTFDVVNCGFYAGLLVLLQILLVSKVVLLVDLYGPRRLQQLHKFNGKLIPIFILDNLSLMIWYQVLIFI